MNSSVPAQNRGPILLRDMGSVGNAHMVMVDKNSDIIAELSRSGWPAKGLSIDALQQSRCRALALCLTFQWHAAITVRGRLGRV